MEPIFDDANNGYRGRSTRDALSRLWTGLEAGYEWVLDAGLKDLFGPVDHDKLLVLVNQRVSEGRVMKLVHQMLTADCELECRRQAV